MRRDSLTEDSPGSGPVARKTITDVLDAFDAALAAPAPAYEPLIGAFRDLVVPSDVTADELTRLYHVCFRLLGIEEGGPPVDLEGHLIEWQAGHLAACAASAIEGTMFDREASKRAWIAKRREGYLARGEAVPAAEDDSSLPPAVDVPFDDAAASDRVRPYLERLEASLAVAPDGHFQLCWDVARDGYPVFRRVVARWLEGVEARGLGVPGTASAIATARELTSKAVAAEPIGWSECETDVLPLLDHPHPMIAAGAAVYLGALVAGGLLEDPDAVDLMALLERLQRQPTNRAAVAGGFIEGSGTSLHALGSDEALKASGFDLDSWVIGLLEAEVEPYLPNAQALWFYVHEHYEADPSFIARLIEIDRSWIAMMCATERHEAVAGMRPVLERLALDRNPAVAAPAREHLDRCYGEAAGGAELASSGL